MTWPGNAAALPRPPVRMPIWPWLCHYTLRRNPSSKVVWYCTEIGAGVVSAEAYSNGTGAVRAGAHQIGTWVVLAATHIIWTGAVWVEAHIIWTGAAWQEVHSNGTVAECRGGQSQEEEEL